MACRKKYTRLSGNSILESVIALSIISVCLYVVILVYTSVFSVKTTARFYNSRNQSDELFFLMQVRGDSINENLNEDISIQEEFLNANLKKISINRNDSTQTIPGKSYYIRLNE